MKKKHKLGTKMTVICMICFWAMGIFICAIGCWEYNRSMRANYDEYANLTMKTAENAMNPDQVEKWIKSGQMNKDYQQLFSKMNQIKTNVSQRVAFLYTLYFTKEGQAEYLMSSYTEEEYEINGDTSIRELGSVVGEEELGEDNFKLIKSSWDNGKAGKTPEYSSMVNRMVNGQVQGVEINVITYYYPVFNSEGDIVCIVCADVKVSDIQNMLKNYILIAAVGAAIIMLIFMIIFMRMINATVIEPINRMANSADDFVSQSRKISNPAQFEIQKINVHTKDEIEMLARSLNDMMENIKTYMMEQEALRSDRQQISLEREVAESIQKNMLPLGVNPFPDRHDFELFSSILDAPVIGGNFYDYFIVNKKYLYIFIGDSKGEGLPASIISMIANMWIAQYAHMEYEPKRILFEANNQLSQNNEFGCNIEAFIARIELDTGKMLYASAGNMQTLMKKSGGVFEELATKEAFLLAEMENVPYFQQSENLVQGDLLFISTSRLSEVLDNRGNVLTEGAISEILNDIINREYHINSIGERFIEEIMSFEKGTVQKMDNSLIVFRYFG